MGSATEIRRLMLRQAGVVSRDQALACGLSPRQLDRLVASSAWVRVHPAVYRLHAVVPSPEASLRAAALWLRGAVLTGAGAAWWWGYLLEPPARWTFSLDSARCPPRAPGLTVNRAFVDPDDRTDRLGITLVSRPWAVLQAAVTLEREGPGRGITLLDRAAQRRWATRAEMELSLQRHARGWGSSTARLLLDRTGDHAHSELERLAVRLLRSAGITGFVVNHRTVLRGGRRVELDIAFLDRRVALELDGYAYHSGPEAHRADLRRANDVMAAGWTVRRFTWSDLLSDPDGFIDTVREVVAL